MSPQLFSDLKVSKETNKALDRLGLEEATPVQAALLAAVQRKRAAVVAAPAVSGRRMALALAAVEQVESGGREAGVLILTVTRDRALQLAATVRSLISGRKSPACGVLVAGQSAARQSAILESGPLILIGTPGRIRAAQQEGGAPATAAASAVLLDGADDLLDTGFEPEVRAVLAAGDRERPILAVTTFISREVEALAGEFCPDADRVVIGPPAEPLLPLTWYDVDASLRLTALSLLADRHQVQRGLVFTATAPIAEELAGRLLVAGYAAEAIVPGLTAAARERALKKFRAGDVLFLVGTESGFRGVETEGADVLVHHGWPADDGVLPERHTRLRAGGQAFALVSGRELIRARAYSRRGSPARMGRLPVLAEIPELRLQTSLSRIREALEVRNPAACRTIVDLLIADGFDPAVVAGAAIRLLGPPALPPQAVPAPLPVPAPAPATATAEPVARGEVSADVSADPAAYEGVPMDEGTDWSPGISDAPPGDGAGNGAGDGAGDGSGEVSPDEGYEYSGGAYSADQGYVITDNVSEDGVVYPPGANFGDEGGSDYGFSGGGGGGERRRGPRRERERGGRARGRGGEGGGAMSPGMKRLWLNVGRMDRIQPKDIVGCILGESGVPPVSVGRVQLFERHSLVDVSLSFESQILEALNRAVVRGRKLKAKIAAY
ncbi:MAG: DEAD/DEAH box helicase [Verrucomicrobiae bacterium]|nr:DEAD/DEAH box helicase [Verrucomicrobiae bacterium]